MSTKKIQDQLVNLKRIDAFGGIIMPEIVDSHTHLVFAGDRSDEFWQRMHGVDYQAIALNGGGILKTMNSTRLATSEELFESAVIRCEEIFKRGVGTVEIKTGYGLTFDDEIKCAEVIHNLKTHFSPFYQIYSTFMPAHALPPEYQSTASYMKEVVLPATQRAYEKQIIDAVDIFFEKNYFSQEDVETLSKFCQETGIALKIHADEFNNLEGGKLAADCKALSADHLLQVSDISINALKKSDTVATLLPGTAMFLGKPMAPARKLIDQGCKVALASDYNPGSCHWPYLLEIAIKSAQLLKMTPAEIITAICYNGAHALGLRQQGVVIPGMKARLSLFTQNQNIQSLFYHWDQSTEGFNPLLLL